MPTAISANLPQSALPANDANGHWTSDQATAYAHMLKLGQLHFGLQLSPSAILPRLSPLLSGPTGSGKSRLCESVALKLGAKYIRLTAGEWVPTGARGTATTEELMRLALSHPRLVLHLDELDKFQPQYQNEWTRSCANSMWDVLEGVLPWCPEHLAKYGEAKLKAVARGIWCVGSGTWQELFESEQAQRPIGFTATGLTAPQDPQHMQNKIRQHRIIPAELLARFSSEILLLRYPSVAEANRLLDVDGWRSRAAQLGYPLQDRLEQLLPQAGFRALQSLVAEILLREHELNPGLTTLADRPCLAPELANSPALTLDEEYLAAQAAADEADNLVAVLNEIDEEEKQVVREDCMESAADDIPLETRVIAGCYLTACQNAPALCIDGCFYVPLQRLAENYGCTAQEVREQLNRVGVCDFTAAELSAVANLRPAIIVLDRDNRPWLAVAATAPAVALPPIAGKIGFEPWVDLNPATVEKLAEPELLFPSYKAANAHDTLLNCYKMGANPAGWFRAYSSREAINKLSPRSSSPAKVIGAGSRWVGPIFDYTRAMRCLDETNHWLQVVGYKPSAVTIHEAGDLRSKTLAHSLKLDGEEIHVVLSFGATAAEELPQLDTFVLYFSEGKPASRPRKQRRCADIAHSILRVWIQSWLNGDAITPA